MDKYNYNLEDIVYWETDDEYNFVLKNGSKKLKATVFDDGKKITTSITDCNCMVHNYRGCMILGEITQFENMMRFLNKG